MKLLPFIKAWAALSLVGIITLPGRAEESTVLLKPPGLRLREDPSTILPAVHRYPNQTLALPDYREPSGLLREGWAMELIETRRFFSNQSGRLYFRTSDLARSTVFNPTPSLGKMRIWPRGTVMIMEIYAGNGGTMGGAEPVEITVMAKVGHRGRSSPPFSYPVDWSYGRFTPEGEPFLLPGQVQECHRCHSIAFHFTGDLVFSQFP